MKKYFWSTIIFFSTFCSACGQTNQRGHSSLDKDYYVDGFKVYTKLSKSDSLKELKDIVAQLNGDWTSTDTIGKTVTEFTWTYELNDTTFKGWLFNPRLILAAPTVELKIINGQVKIIHYRSIGQYLIPDDTSNIKIVGNELTIGSTTYQRLKHD
jgi:hypothetical protein